MSNELLIQIAADVAATKTAVEALAGPQGRVTKLEDEAIRQGWQTWAKSVAVGVVTLFGHGLARRIGLDV